MAFKKTRNDNVFTESAVSSVESSRFDLGHEKKFTCNMGELIPCCLMEVIPGDKFNLSYVNMVRFAPLIAPVMHKVKVRTEYFFVPNRIIFDAWEQFITGTAETPIEWPHFTPGDEIDKGTLGDYLGIPAGDYSLTPDMEISCLPLAAYLKVFDDWYRDQNLQTPVYETVSSGNNFSYQGIANSQPKRRAWEHDYFTSCLPEAQQGDPVSIPLTFQQDVPVDWNFDPTASADLVRSPSTGVVDALVANFTSSAGGGLLADGVAASIDNSGRLTVDIQSDAATLNDLREAWALQAFLERSLRGGNRYIEQTYVHFGVKSSDARLQRPELIGMSSQNVTISEVLATAQNMPEGVAVGTMAGHGISVGGSPNMYYEAEEHGFILGIVSIVPETSYQDGLHRLWSRRDRLDYPFPSFAHIGEQAVLNKEVRSHDINPVTYDPEGTFGYIPRYSEMRYIPSTVAGDFRDNLSFWTLGRIFDGVTPPALNEEFITCDPRLDIFANTTETDDHIYMQVINAHSAVRKLPRYGVPATLT